MKRALRSGSRSRGRSRLLNVPRVLLASLGVSAMWGVTGSLSAEPIFRSAFLSFDVGLRPNAVAVGDLNEDGNADLVVGFARECGYGNQVSVLLGNGGGTFAAKVYYEVGHNPAAVAIADLNRDGKLDLAVANSGSLGFFGNTVSVLLGNGNGTFAAKTDYVTGTAPSDVAIADVNEDGVADLLVAINGVFNMPGNAVSLLLGNGDGTFAARMDYATGPLPHSMAIADLNGDGHVDLVTANRGVYPGWTPSLSVLLGNGNGTFGAHADIARGADALALADVNEDGIPDLITARDGVSVLLGNGDGTFGANTDYATGEGDPNAVAIGDLNGDAHLDLALGIAYELTDFRGTIAVLLGNGNGTFGEKTEYPSGTRSPSSLAISDVNADGRPDLAVADGSESSTSVLLGNGDGTFGAERHEYGTGTGPRQVVICDLNGDRAPDVVTANSATVSVLLGNGTGAFGERTDYGTGAGPSMAIGDLNADGKPDLAVGSTSVYPAGVFSVFLGNGNGAFGPKTDYDAGTRPGSVVIGDLNGDGKPDLVTAYRSFAPVDGVTLSVLLGNGDGTFGAGTEFGYGIRIHPASLATSDLNRDGKADLVVAGEWFGIYCGGGDCGDLGVLSVLLGNGDGTFGVKATYGAGDRTRHVVVDDVNSDGNPDLVTANRNTVAVLLGNGDGTFVPALHWTGEPSTSVAVGDLNWDGHRDLVTANYSFTVSAMLGNGDGTFGAAVGYGSEERPAVVAIGDVNRDRRLDLVTTNLAANSISVFLNIGPRAPVLEASIDLDPAVIAFSSRSPWITAYIELAGIDPAAIEVGTLLLAGAVPAVSQFAVIGDHNGNGLLDLMVKFSREALDPLLHPGMNVLVVTGGLMTGERFEGRDQVRVMDAPGVARSASVTPNPLYRTGTLRFRTSRPGPVKAAIYDIQGRRVRTLMDSFTVPTGTHVLPIDGRNANGGPLASGVYFYRVETVEGLLTGRIVLQK